MPRLAVLMYTFSGPVHLTKDPCSYAYYLAAQCGYETCYVYFAEEPMHDVEFEKKCRLVHLGDESDYRKQIEIGKEWLKENATNIDVLMLFNYGTSTYRTANYAKRVNPNIKVWCKLDMGKGGFSHFYDGTLLRRLKCAIERFKNRNVDLFTVENKEYYDILQKEWVFRNRIKYLPNCVSTMNADYGEINSVAKENIVLQVGRPGDPNKNSELLVEAINKLPKDILKQWKFYFVGTCSDNFIEWLKNKTKENNLLQECVVLTGPINDRTRLYTLYAKAKIFALTSWSEGFNISVVEAMYHGACPLLTDYGSSTYMMTDHERYGRISKSYKAEDFAKILMNLMQQDLNSKAISKYAREQYSYEVWTRKLDEYITQLY